MKSDVYQSFLETLSKNQWERTGLKRRAGVCAPLFSIYSKESTGIGELPDLRLLADWCVMTKMSIIQLLPMNDVGFNFRPYDAESAFALEPMYLSLENLAGIDTKKFTKEIQKLKMEFPSGLSKVNYGIKKAKLNLLRQMFQSFRPDNFEAFHNFKKVNSKWLKEYALFKIIQEKQGGKHWEEWPDEFKTKHSAACEQIAVESALDTEFHKWLEWQLDEQLRAAKAYANQKGVLLMGDIPFLVSRNSADVWAHQDYFKLDRISGAPPDAFFAKGQRWGMPPYNWENIAKNNYDYIISKLKYAQNFYDLFRIDHVVGIFRLWTIPNSEPFENGGLNGRFDPENENEWEAHGRNHLSAMVQNTAMLPCSEDLGVVPDCSFRVLHEFGIPGIDVERWKKNWQSDYDFVLPENYRKNSIAVISTHDMTSLAGWWEFEAGTVDEVLFRRKCDSRGISFDQVKEKLFDLSNSFHNRLRWKDEIENVSLLSQILGKPEHEIKDFVDLYCGSYQEKRKFWDYLGLPGKPTQTISHKLVKATLEKIGQTISIFSVQMLQDLLSLSEEFHCDAWNFRVNFPGTVRENNWSFVMPFSLEKMQRLKINAMISDINTSAGRS